MICYGLVLGFGCNAPDMSDKKTASEMEEDPYEENIPDDIVVDSGNSDEVRVYTLDDQLRITDAKVAAAGFQHPQPLCVGRTGGSPGDPRCCGRGGGCPQSCDRQRLQASLGRGEPATPCGEGLHVVQRAAVPAT